MFGYGFAGILRRFIVYPVTAICPKVLPGLALNRALTVPERKGEIANGWKISRYRFFWWCSVAMFIYFWLPGFFVKCLSRFNWITWIAPENFALGMITGGYGGMGFNPLATLDWNLSGHGALTTPFYSAVQQYGMRVVSGLIIIAMYWSGKTGAFWSKYMPINSNEGEYEAGRSWIS